MSRDICERFGERIRALREAQGISQMALAEKVEVEQPYISLVENGKQEPCLRNIEKLATGLKTPLAELFRDL
jgi:transcriptional regulator with XRE-family HTH domain